MIQIDPAYCTDKNINLVGHQDYPKITAIDGLIDSYCTVHLNKLVYIILKCESFWQILKNVI